MSEPPDPAERSGFARTIPRLLKSVSRVDVGMGVVVLVCSLIAAFSVWYTSAGQFPAFPEIQNDYLELGRAFLHGHVDLPENPDPRLADLGNPYDSSQRKHLEVHWDASYYNGRYYLYWGPVPALVAAALENIADAPPSASVLVLIPYLGLLGVFLALLVEASTYCACPPPRLSFGLLILAGFVNLPLMNLIGTPRIYQASIIYGQFFLLSGLLGFLLAVRRQRSAWLVMGGLGWGLALGCRYNLLFSVAIFLLFAALWLWRQAGTRAAFKKMGVLLAPLLLCLIGLGAYNFVRFKSPLETGLTYQLTIAELAQQPYSIRYIPSNLYLYLAYPLTPAQSFPFIRSAHFSAAVLPPWLVRPPGSQVDQIVFGVLSSAPAFWLSGLAMAPIIALFLSAGSDTMIRLDRLAKPSPLAMLGAAAAAQLFFLLVFFYATERYIADFYLPAVLCLGIVVWKVDAILRSVPFFRAALWLAVVALTFWTAGIGYFSCFGVPNLVANSYDPAMIAQLARFWNTTNTGLRSLLP